MAAAGVGRRWDEGMESRPAAERIVWRLFRHEGNLQSRWSANNDTALEMETANRESALGFRRRRHRREPQPLPGSVGALGRGSRCGHRGLRMGQVAPIILQSSDGTEQIPGLNASKACARLPQLDSGRLGRSWMSRCSCYWPQSDVQDCRSLGNPKEPSRQYVLINSKGPPEGGPFGSLASGGDAGELNSRSSEGRL